MGRRSRVVKIIITVILTLSMVLGSYVGVSAVVTYAHISDTSIYLDYSENFDLDLIDNNSGDSYYTSNVNWISSNTGIATVNSNGNVTAKMVSGQTIVTVNYNIYKQRIGPDQFIGSYSDTCTVNVRKVYDGAYFDINSSLTVNYIVNTNDVMDMSTPYTGTVTNYIVKINDGSPLAVMNEGDYLRASKWHWVWWWLVEDGVDVVETDTVTVTADINVTIDSVIHTIPFSATFDTPEELAAIAVGSDGCHERTGFVITIPDQNIVVDKYTATFNFENGAAPETTTYIKGDNIIKPSDPVKADLYVDSVLTESYVFDGWLEEDATAAEPEDFTNITSQRTFTASYIVTEYNTVTFEDWDASTIDAISEIPDGSNLLETDVPSGMIRGDDTSVPGVKIVYTFAGWDDKDTGSVENYSAADIAAMTIDTNRTFAAVYSETYYYTIFFYEEDGISLIDTREVVGGSTLTDFPTAPGKPDSLDGLYYYTFNQWVTEGNDPAIFTDIGTTFSVKAQYTENSYIVVNFYVQLPDNTTLLIDTQYILPGGNANDPAPDWMLLNNYILGDWDGTLTGLETNTDLTARAANVAGEQEKNEYTVNFYVQLPDGSKILISTQKVLAGDNAIDPGAAWMLNNNYILGPWNGSLTNILQDTDLTARAAVVAGAAEVQTGEDTPIVSMSILLAAAAFSIVFITSRRRKDA